MPKPTRRERRRLAEQGKLAPRRAPVSTPAARTTVPRTSPRADVGASTKRTRAIKTVDEPPMLPDKQEYAYVKSDLMRIMLLAGTLVAAMVALKFVLPQ